jgi:succinoglycan biosynthesis transport protein ExoP
MNELQHMNFERQPLQPQLVEGSTCLAIVPYSQASNSAISPTRTSAGLLAEYHGLLGRHTRMIVVCTLIGALAGFLITVGKLSVYRARTSLDIQNLNGDFMNMKEIAPTAGGDSSSSDDSYVQTQIKLLQSETLRQRTVKKMLSGPYPASLTRNDLLSQMEKDLRLSSDQTISKAALVNYASKNVVVKPLGTTRLVEMTCDSWNAKFSADFCNTLATEFSEQDREVRWNEAQKTSEWLTRQLADVRDSLSMSEKKLEAATGADAMVLHHGGDSISGEKLDELQTELTKAQSERVAKQAQYEIGATAPADSLPTILDDSEFRDGQMKLEDLRRQVAALVPPLTEENPKVKHLRAQIAEVQGTLTTKKQDLLQRITNEYREAQQRESLLSSAYSLQERKVAGEQAKDAQVSMLRHEVDSEQQLYQTLLQKVKEAGFASALQASTVRVVDAADAPEQPIAPRRAISTLVGCLLGVIVGIAAAFTKERTETTLRAPGDVPRYLSLRELGVIPSAKRAAELSTGRISISSRVRTALGPAATEVVSSRSDGARTNANNMDMRMWKDHASLVTEAFRSATYSILLAGRQSDASQVYVISSPSVSEGKTTVTCNLGFALAQANRRVLLIDGDLRKPRLHKAFGLANDVGFRDLLQGHINLNASPLMEYCRPTMLPNLALITSGQGSDEPVSLLHSPRCQEVIEYLKTQFDIILIDTPPVTHMADARILGGLATGAILVFRSRQTDREAAAGARDLFVNDRVRVIGTILNDFNPEKEGKTGYYNSYYSYRQDLATAGAPFRKGNL